MTTFGGPTSQAEAAIIALRGGKGSVGLMTAVHGTKYGTKCYTCSSMDDRLSFSYIEQPYRSFSNQIGSLRPGLIAPTHQCKLESTCKLYQFSLNSST